MDRFSGLLVLGAMAGIVVGCSHANEMMGPAVVASGPVKVSPRSVVKFSRVSVSDAIHADITIGATPSVKVEAASGLLPLVATNVDGNELVVSVNQKVTVSGVIKVHIVTPDLDAVQASGAAQVTATSVKSSGFDLTVSGASVVSVDGILGSGRLDASGASHVTLAGVADDFKFGASGASVVDATNLTTKKASVNCDGASTADIGKSDEIAPTASGASTIHYLGNPQVTNPDASGASTIEHG